MGRTAPLTSKRCILYIYSTNTCTEHFKRALYSPSFSLQNAVCFIMLTCLVSVLFTFYIQDVLKLKNNSGAKGLIWRTVGMRVKRENRSTRRNTSPIVTLPTTYITWTGLRPNPVFCGMRLETNRQILMNITRCVLRNYYPTFQRRVQTDGSRLGGVIFKT